MEFPLSDEDIGSLLLAGLGLEYLDSSMLALSPTPFKVPVYTLGKRLGGGAFGNVFEAEMEKTGAKCAVKRIYLRSSDSDEDNDNEEESESENECNGIDKEKPAAAATTSAENNNRMENKNELKAHKEGEEVTDEKNNEVNTNNNNAEAASEENKLVCGSGSNSNNSKKHRTKVNGVTSQLREIAQEVEIMSSLCHPNIVRYMFCERDDNCISIFMELCSGGSLGHLLKQYQTYLTANSISNHSTANSHTHNSTSSKHTRLINSSAKSGHAIRAHDNTDSCNNNNNSNNALYMMLDDPERIKKILTEIISAVNYLHTKRIVHRDLKPDNVLFSCEGHAKVSDFGTAVHKQNEALSNVKGTVAYMAPEILVGDKYGKACDI